MRTSDHDVKMAVRRTLSRHWVDLHAVRYLCNRGSVRFQGHLHRLDQSPSPPYGSLLEAIESETRRIPGVRGVFFNLENWVRDSQGRWAEKSRHRSAELADGVVLELQAPSEPKAD